MRGVRKMLIIFGTLIVVIIAALVGRYFYNNMYYDKNIMNKVTKAGFVEKKITLEDAKKVQSLIATCERIDIKSGHDIHFEHPDKFIDACEKLLK